MVSIREPMRFIPDSLKQMQRAGIGRQLQRHRAARAVNLLMLFRQTNDWQVVQPQSLQFPARR